MRLITIWVDGGYRGKDFQHWVMDVYRWILSVVTRHEELLVLLYFLNVGWLSELLVGLTGADD